MKEKINEDFWGSLFGIVAIVAAIVEMILGGFSIESVVAGIKDIAGTAIVIFVMIAFLRNLPKKEKNLAEKLEKDVEDWGIDNAPLIFKTENYIAAQNTEFEQGFVLLQDPRRYVSLSNSKLNKENPEWHKYAQYGNGKLTGKFLDMPSYKAMTKDDFNVMIVMEQSHFRNMPEIDSVIKDIVSAINAHGNDGIFAERIGASNKIRLVCKKIETIAGKDHFVDMLDFILSLVKVVA